MAARGTPWAATAPAASPPRSAGPRGGPRPMWTTSPTSGETPSPSAIRSAAREPPRRPRSGLGQLAWASREASSVPIPKFAQRVALIAANFRSSTLAPDAGGDLVRASNDPDVAPRARDQEGGVALVVAHPARAGQIAGHRDL